MLGLNEIIALIASLFGMGGMTWVMWRKLQERKNELADERKENQRLQEQQQKVVVDAQERKAEEAKQRSQGGAADRLRDSRWVRDEG